MVNASPILLAFCCALWLTACNDAKPGGQAVSRSYSPDKTQFVELVQGKLSTQEIWVGPQRLLLAEGLPSMCGVTLAWQESGELLLRLPEPYRRQVRVLGSSPEEAKLRVEFHEDGVILTRHSPDRGKRIIVVKNCEDAAWDLYLRLKGRPNFDERMRDGWGDPTLLGGFDRRRILKSLRWTGNAKVIIEIQGYRSGATLRESISGITIEWKFKPPT